MSWKALGAWAVAGLVGGTAVVAVVRYAAEERTTPKRCPPPLVDQGRRCCAVGQREEAGQCLGRPERCPPLALTRETGCVATQESIAHPAGELELSPADWEAQGLVTAKRIEVKAFGLDRTEVTVAEWNRCATTERCREVTGHEPGLPVTGITPSEAEAYCRFAGGRLPSAEEWTWAAAGTEGHRYPWGDTGLVCRRAVYGTQDGPCGLGATSPELAGSMTDGQTLHGVFDLAGNVAEWTREADGSHTARGGSFRSTLARELKVWAAERSRQPASHIGFRCAYSAQ